MKVNKILWATDTSETQNKDFFSQLELFEKTQKNAIKVLE